ncbi:Rqc2 family fibronectin-binding protein [Thermobrachium celere]|uniref:Rqc2 homolog RqcH n=1 Tax=Thermobrachium celere DSM 8682 TaxID=941824 RepID=R7RNV0_9CLOT|nr:NFACT RNA binding domain-containing protein [Thermobrachium celere]CDF57877.1 Fibronectin/fibrinogen-binding protein [Thermobrachium celere DSM 8682]
MPFDGLVTKSIINELNEFINSKIDKIYQPNSEEIILILRKEKKSKKLLISINPTAARFHLTDQSVENPIKPPSFCMVLRKYIQNGRILNLEQVSLDRILKITIEIKDELGYPKIYYLIAETMGKHSNIILINSENVIIDSLKHIDFTISSVRQVLPKLTYQLPPTKTKVNPLDISKENFIEIILNDNNKKLNKALIDNFYGISNVFCDLVCKDKKDVLVSDLTSDELEHIANRFFYYIAKIKSNSIECNIFTNNKGSKDFYIFDVMENDEKTYYTSPSEMIDAYYFNRSSEITMKQKYKDLYKLVESLYEKADKKVESYINKIEECKDFEVYKLYAELILANQYNININNDTVYLQNYYDENLSIIEIPYISGLSPVEMSQYYYKKYNKDKNTYEMLGNSLNQAKQEKEYLETVLINLENATDSETIEEIRNELILNGFIKKKIINKKTTSSPMHYISSDGYDIYIGKSNIQNDYLTTKFASQNDIWMHTKNIPGSHVIIKSKNGTVSDTALLEGALLAAYYSKAKNSTNVPVDYTERKNVKKPNGAKPGMVIYYTNKTIYVTPSSDKIEKLKRVK